MVDPFPAGEASVHLWHGAEDLIVPVQLSRYITENLPWVRYHELSTSGHLFPFADGMPDTNLSRCCSGTSDVARRLSWPSACLSIHPLLSFSVYCRSGSVVLRVNVVVSRGRVVLRVNVVVSPLKIDK
jgi:hypothetical protein